ncbi:hypothetical protein HK102_005492 [Quaeritorhiza haematococci]|nr:hypothetical protein HK102_005492 [Quaeritorhiza haematococci]
MKAALSFAKSMSDVVVRDQTFTGTIRVIGWGSVGGTPICNGTDQGTLPCPDMIVLGTTQIPERFYKGELEPLAPWFARYATTEQSNIIDEFYKGTYYDYKIGETWIGVPLTTDIRPLYYNKTLLKQLNLTEPPPVGNWGTDFRRTWTWSKFLEYAAILKASGLSPGFQILSGWQEEHHQFMPTFGRLADARLVDENGICGLRKKSWYDAIETYVRKPLLDGTAKYLYSPEILQTQPALVAYLNNPDPNADVLSNLNAYNSLVPVADWGCPNPNGIGLVMIGCLYGEYIRNPNETGIAFPPGGFNFLGGAGAVLTRYSKNKEKAWEFLTNLVSPTRPYLVKLNTDGGVPPFESFADDPFYSGPFYEVSRRLMRFAIPDQFPDPPYRQWGALETLKPFRMMMLEMIYKNFTAQIATDRMCKVIEYLFGKISVPHVTFDLTIPPHMP